VGTLEEREDGGQESGDRKQESAIRRMRYLIKTHREPGTATFYEIITTNRWILDNSVVNRDFWMNYDYLSFTVYISLETDCLIEECDI
jgi:hypothetical protein